MLRPLLCAAWFAVLASCNTAAGEESGAVDSVRGPVLRRFASTRHFADYVTAVRRRLDKDDNSFSSESATDVATLDAAEPVPAAPPAETLGSPAGQATINPAITNTQTAGVDEGGIVKQIGRFLIVLQDGRLFSADLGPAEGAPLRLAGRIDVYRDAKNAPDWYDEMLVLGDRILVTAYSYRDAATEISVFRLGPRGDFSREGRFLISSNDYYSTENYATRLVGDQLVLYAPFALDPYERPFQWPRLRRADGAGEADGGDALIGATDVYAPPGNIERPVLHTVSVCPLKGRVECRTTAFVGAAVRDLYVSPTDVFLWVGAPDGLPWSIDYANLRRAECPLGRYRRGEEESAGMIYRLPLDGSMIGAVAAEGIPADQFAFDSRDGRLRALLSQPAPECGAYGDPAPLALLDLPLAAFGKTVRHVAASAYTPLPAIGAGQIENRFIGDWLVYGGRRGWASEPDEGHQAPPPFVAVPLARPKAAIRLAIPHNAVRVDRIGADAVVSGYSGAEGLSLSYVSLARGRPAVAATATLPGRFESEGRSHAFNAWQRPDGSGLIAFPTSTSITRSNRDWSNSESSDLSFVALSPAKALAAAGELAARTGQAARGYRCDVSCFDWYGNSRPVFTGGRIFALLGTELVEGRMDGGRIRELTRLDLTGRPEAGRPSSVRRSD
jgi:hypothetical protein